VADATVAVCTCESDAQMLRRVLAAAADQVNRPVLVVDMSRTDAVERAAADVAGVHYVPFPDSSGLSASRNMALTLARSRHLIFLDDDAIPEPGWASALSAALARHGVAIAGARVLAPDDLRVPPLMRTATASDWLSLFDLGPQPREVPRVVGTSFAIDLERTGDLRFDETLGYGPGRRIGQEEVRFALAARRAGWRCWYEATAVVRHHFGRERASWRAMSRRAYAAGREGRVHDEPLEPLPRRMKPADHVFRALIAPAYLAGRLRSRR
jgi:glucosyl-dolichyl phosphate glucuronosyltransferase